MSSVLATTDDLKRFMKGGSLAYSDQDDILTEALSAAAAAIETYCSRTFASQQYVEYYDANTRGVIELDQWPVSAIAEVKEFGRVLNVGQDPSLGTLDVVAYYKPETEYVARLVRFLASWIGTIRSVKVTYTAGYQTIPADLRRACCNMAAIFLFEPMRIGVESSATERHNIVYDRDLPKPLMRVLDSYRRVQAIAS